jgi:hypothetical protein
MLVDDLLSQCDAALNERKTAYFDEIVERKQRRARWLYFS